MKESATLLDPRCAERDIEFILRICMLLNTVRSMHQALTSSDTRELLGTHMLSFLRELVPADDGAILLGDQLHRDGMGKRLIQRLEAKRETIVESVDGRHIVALPLLVRHDVAGMIYLERQPTSPLFDEGNLLILAAVAQMTSVALENAFHLEWLQGEVRRLEFDLDPNDELLGDGPKLKELRSKIARVAPTQATVLIIGESGTGKELVARSLHRQSPRAGKPFVAINCAALTESLLESELFGHDKGAFTGAVVQKRGRMETAEGGTVFLDEIGEMPLNLQAKILRVIQNREFERVGGTRTLPLDVRLIAATNRDLEEAIRTGQFRKDLYYRLNVVTLKTPPLRDRPEDIIQLAIYFAQKFGDKCGRSITGVSAAARNALRRYEWPGNVRELENAIEHAVVLGSSDTIVPEDLPEALYQSRTAASESGTGGMLQQAIDLAKRSAVKRAFELTGQDHAEAARLLGVHPNYLYRLLRNMNLQAFVKSMPAAAAAAAGLAPQ